MGKWLKNKTCIMITFVKIYFRFALCFLSLYVYIFTLEYSYIDLICIPAYQAFKTFHLNFYAISRPIILD